jgi:hypothetical protein
MSTPNIYYFSDLHPNRVTNLAGDRANIHHIRTENLDVGTSVELPDGSLNILTRGAGVPLTSLPEAGALTSNDFQLRTLTAGTAVSLVSTADNITINNTSPASSVTLGSAGGDESLVNDGVGPALATKGLSAGAGITLSSGPNAVTITNSSAATSVTLTSAGGQSIVSDGTGPSLAVKGTSPTPLLEDTSTGGVIQFDNRCIRCADQNGAVPPLDPAANATVNGSNRAIAAGFGATVGANCLASAALGPNTVVSANCDHAIAFCGGQASDVKAAALGHECLAFGVNAWSMGYAAQAGGNRSMCWALSDGTQPYLNTFADSVAIGQNFGSVPITYFGCTRILNTDILGFAITRGRLAHGMRRDPTSRTLPYTLNADDVIHGSVRCIGGAGTLTTPTGAQLINANNANPIWWAVNTGADFYLKNKSGGAVTLAAGTDVVIIDQTNAAVASMDVADDNVGHFRVIYTGSSTFEFEFLGSSTIPGVP